MVQKDIKDNKDILINPGKGLVLYGASHISSEQYIVPKFVFEKGANFDTAVNENGVLQYIPDWQDPTFLKYLNKFVKALGDYFNGNKNIAYIDIRSYGNFGEQHLFGLKVDDNYSWKKKIDSTFLKEKYIKPYMDAFPDTLLINPWGDDDYNDTYEEVLNQGVSLRRDGIVEYDNGLDFLAKAYGKLPVIFEYAGNYKDYIKNGTEDYFNERLEDAIAISKPSYVELDMDWYNNNKSYCEDLANRIGYYFRFKKAVYYQEEKVNTPTDMILSFKNDGIAPIYEDCSVYVGLLNQSNKLVQKYKVDINPKEWQPGKHVNKKISINFNNVNSGNYKLAVGLYKKDEDKKTTYLIVI